MPEPDPAPPTAGPAPAADHDGLPARPMTVADVPPGAPLARGRLLWYHGPRARPFVALEVRCPYCRSRHRHPFRWDWGLSPDVVSFQAAGCRVGPKPPYWVALDPDPAAIAASAEAHRQARDAFERWRARGAELKAARKAAGPVGGVGGSAVPDVE